MRATWRRLVAASGTTLSKGRRVVKPLTTLEKDGGLTIPLDMPRMAQSNLRNPAGSGPAPFPEALIKKKP